MIKLEITVSKTDMHYPVHHENDGVPALALINDKWVEGCWVYRGGWDWDFESEHDGQRFNEDDVMAWMEIPDLENLPMN